MPGFSSPLAEQLAADVLARFKRYVRVDTRSDVDSDTCPTTRGQLELGRMLAGELEEIGLQDVEQDANGYVFATLPGAGRLIGVLPPPATSREVRAPGVEPIVHRGYDGEAIALPRGDVVIDTAQL